MPTVRVLLAEDVPSDAELELRELKRAGLRTSHKLVDSEERFLEALHSFAPDVILSDFSMPQFDGMAALLVARERAPDVPFIFVSGTIGEEYAIRALKSGATDYVLKTNLVRLPAAVERAVAEARERRIQRRTALELDQARERLSSILETLEDVLWSMDGRGERLLFIGPTAARVFGEPAEDLQRDPGLWLELSHPEDRPRLEAAWARLRAGTGIDIEYRTIWRNGTQRWVNQRARAIRSPDGTIERIDGIARDITQEAEQRQRIRHLALYDPLTDLPNRTLFHERLSQDLQNPALCRPGLALVLIDLERFKAINDVLGTPGGNEVLKALAVRLVALAGDAHQVARLGSNLFAVKLFAIAEREALAADLDRAGQRLFATPFETKRLEVRVSAKAGIAVFPQDGDNADALFRNAEAALMRAKETGEQRVFYTPEINAWVSEQVDLENRLRSAVENGELHFHYQPKVDLATRRVVGAEALMRWNGPDGKPVSPAKFIPILEQTGLILEAGRQALVAASQMYRRWQVMGYDAPRIAVNVSALQLRRQKFVADVSTALVEPLEGVAGVDLEITESLLMSDVEETVRKLHDLRDMGLRIALDDFGTGYSSLAYLSRLPIDTIKIDRAFVRGMTEHRANLSIIMSIISLARALKLRVVAEGVETAEQAAALLELGCDEAQGYLFSPPAPPEALERLLR